VGQEGVRTVQDSWDGLTCLTFGACTKEHLPKVGQDGETDLGMVSHLHSAVHVPPKEHIYTKGGAGEVEDSPG
jgi:hypothetical protein